MLSLPWRPLDSSVALPGLGLQIGLYHQRRHGVLRVTSSSRCLVLGASELLQRVR